MKHLRFFALGICVFTLAACQQTWDGIKKDFDTLGSAASNISSRTSSSNTTSTTGSENFVINDTCPGVEVVDELGMVAEFTDPNTQTPANLISKANIAKIQNSCSYSENSVTIDLRMDVNGERGAASTGPASFSYPFFVAVTSANGQILAKEIFAAPLSYAAGEVTQNYSEKLRQIIPVEEYDRGTNYKVLVGFQLTPDQLAYNRQIIAEEQLRRDAQALQPNEYQQQTIDAQNQAAKDFGNPTPLTP